MNTPFEIFEEYKSGVNFKSSFGKKGLYEQTKINERFYVGDQWYGAKCGNDRPLVRHNVIKRIGDYKMSQILSEPLTVLFSAEGIPTGVYESGKDAQGINAVMQSLSEYHSVTAERVKLNSLHEQVLKNSYVSGTGVLYTYWDEGIKTGLYSDKGFQKPINGDIACEVLSIENIILGDPYIQDLQNQPFIIISSCRETEEVLRQARLSGADLSTLTAIEKEAVDGKITVLTKLYKEYNSDTGYKIKGIKVTEKNVVKNEFDTGLTLYPLALFAWEKRGSIAYGESEITYLIPNQIAINRMITANVWSAMTTGMPIMVVNGDTVPAGITNEPGQVVKVYGSNEDVEGAVKYVAPPSFAKSFDESAQSLINNTLTQSGANEVALGDSRADNATALLTMRTAALLPLQLVKNRFFAFAEEVARIWADFWVAYYGKRQIKLIDKNGIRYMSFNSVQLKSLTINAKCEVGTGSLYNDKDCLSTLITLYDKGIITREQFIKRMPDGIIPDKDELILVTEEDKTNDGI